MLSDDMPDKVKEILRGTWPQIFLTSEMTTKTRIQPEWVCNDCGIKYGYWFSPGGEYNGPASHCSTWHSGHCSVCGQVKAVTEARDFGYLRKGWQDELR